MSSQNKKAHSYDHQIYVILKARVARGRDTCKLPCVTQMNFRNQSPKRTDRDVNPSTRWQICLELSSLLLKKGKLGNLSLSSLLSLEKHRDTDVRELA